MCDFYFRLVTWLGCAEAVSPDGCVLADLSLKKIPLLVDHGNGLVGSEIELTWNNGDIVICNCPLVVVFAFVEVDKVTHHPEVAPSVWIKSLVKVFNPFRVSLAADAHTAKSFISFW